MIQKSSDIEESGERLHNKSQIPDVLFDATFSSSLTPIERSIKFMCKICSRIQS